MKQMLLIFLPLLLFPSCDKDISTLGIESPIYRDTGFQVVVKGMPYNASLYDTPAAKAFLAMLPLTVHMEELNDNEKHADLPNSLPVTSIRPDTIRKGDILLYGSSTLVLFYKTFLSPYSYTRIGQIDNPSELEVVLGTGSVTVRFERIPSTSL